MIVERRRYTRVFELRKLRVLSLNRNQFTSLADMDVDDCKSVCLPITVEDTLSLRHTVLWPNAPLSQVCLPEDANGYHFGAFFPLRREPVAVISVFIEPLPIDAILDDEPAMLAVRFRKFACEPTHQNRGIGSHLLLHVFSLARSELRATVAWCDARTTSAGWYEKRGMVAFGQPFFKGPVEYIRMKIKL